MPDFQIIDGVYRIPATYDVVPDSCPKCGVVGNLYKHGTKKQTFVDAPVHGLQTFIDVTRLRFRCRDCGGTFMQPLPDMDDARRMTVRCRNYIAEQSVYKPNTHIADDIGINEKVVRQIGKEYGEELIANHNQTIRAPRVLGIDELKIGKEMRAIFTDIETSWPIELLPSRSREAVTHFLSNLPGRKETQVVTIDMWKPYKEAVAYAMPQAVIVVDKWHVQRLADDAMETARRRYQGLLKDKDRKELKRGKAIFLKAPYKLTEAELLNLDGWLKNVPELEGAYETKEAFKAIWKHRTAAKAKEALDEWRASIRPELKPLFRPTLTATKNWEKEILNYFDNGRYTNAPTEARNRVIKMINRIGAGYSFDAIRTRALFGKRPGRKPKRRQTMIQCQSCKAYFEPVVVSTAHIKPISKGDKREPRNQITLCANCHKLHTQDWFKPDHDSTPKSD